ncbi:MAG TPA: mechanosensitive ion channel family protein [Rhizomicrobium sp.]|nr:mechanosensitive ion channel family protein [Rhizomicrobium sp.]
MSANGISPAFITDLRLLMVNSGIRLIAAIVILVVGWMVATWAKRWILAALEHLPLDATLKPLLASLVRYVLLIVTVVLVLDQFGVQTASFIAVLGAAGIAIGLALQGTLSNVAAGVMLLILRPFRVGHFVEVAGGHQGTVREIGLFTTIITARDLYYVSIPNSAIFSATIINYTRDPTRRLKFNIPVDRVNDLEMAETAILAAVEENAAVLETPPPSVVVSELQEYTAVMTVRAFVRSRDYWRVMYALQKSVNAALNEAGILIAVPRQAVANRTEPRNPLTEPPPASS